MDVYLFRIVILAFVTASVFLLYGLITKDAGSVTVGGGLYLMAAFILGVAGGSIVSISGSIVLGLCFCLLGGCLTKTQTTG